MTTIPLIFLNCGEAGKVKEILGGDSIIKRLFEMGLNTGAEVRMVKNDSGPVILYTSGSKLALGRGLAQKIMIEK
ncbi:ferrous iron transport protein A [Tissierella sp. MSJ-40]|jgi:ferrous iron transport protein A|uniref:Ferrous iron transport protein A n=1 Tax=Tissierella simiarum TaxID=2841534 RepID=A0ABS6E336_9FIRM|nr:ferrous iron transport protein A [Tissierella simiarum]MBU5437187.1 ferrous iron transport protein A [Tissierella simiarum]